MLAVFAVCVFIPGPFDEIAMVLVAGTMMAIQPVRARRAASAWKGGKITRGRMELTYRYPEAH